MFHTGGEFSIWEWEWDFILCFCFLFLFFFFFALRSTSDSISFPHCSHPPSEKMGKICKFCCHWLSPSPWPSVTALKELQYEYLHLILNMIFLALSCRICPIKFIVFLHGKGFRSPEKDFRKKQATGPWWRYCRGFGEHSQDWVPSFGDCLILGIHEANSLLLLFLP